MKLSDSNTLKRLSTTHKVYVTVRSPEENLAYQVRFQQPTNEYAIIELREAIDQEVQFKSLDGKGFNYDIKRDDPIIIYNKKEAINVLQNSRTYSNNEPATVDTLIDLLKQCKNLY